MNATISDAGRFLIENAHIVDPANDVDAVGSVLVENGRIAGIRHDAIETLSPDTARIDGRGLHLAPGLIDCFVTTGEPGEEARETFATAGQAAAAGGITTIVTLPDTNPVIDDIALLEYLRHRAARECIVNVLPLAAATRGCAGREMTEYGLMREAGAIAITDAYSPIADALLMRRILAYAAVFSLPLLHHVEVPELATGVMNEGELSTRLGLAGIPNAAETIMLERDLRLAELTGGLYHAALLSTGDAAAALARAKDAGLKVSAGTAPQYFTLNELEVTDYRSFAKVSPPLRAEEDRQAIAAALKDGTIDVITSAHRPQDVESKRLPFAQAASGIVGLETLLAASLQLYHGGELPLPRLIAAMTCNPARLFGLDRGNLAKGAVADMILFDTDAPWIVDAAVMKSKCKNTPFDKRPMQGRVRATWVGGRRVFGD